MTTDDVSPWLLRAVYLFGLALMLTAAIDLFTTVWPLRLTDMTWRYGFLGLAAGYLQTPALGVFMIILAGVWEEDRLVLRVGGLFSLTIAVILLGCLALFALDVLAMRSIRAADVQAGVLAGGVFQEVKYFLATFVFGFMGYGALRSARNISSGRRPKAGIVASAQ